MRSLHNLGRLVVGCVVLHVAISMSCRGRLASVSGLLPFTDYTIITIWEGLGNQGYSYIAIGKPLQLKPEIGARGTRMHDPIPLCTLTFSNQDISLYILRHFPQTMSESFNLSP